MRVQAERKKVVSICRHQRFIGILEVAVAWWEIMVPHRLICIRLLPEQLIWFTCDQQTLSTR